MTNEIATADQIGWPVKTIVARRQRMLQIMKEVMEKDKHYGKIPGCPKPSLYKAGGETLLVSFMLAGKPTNIQDLSGPDVSKYVVTYDVTDIRTGALIASGVGSCSSHEEKYMWRAAICQQEFDETPADRKRLKWKKKYVWNDKTKKKDKVETYQAQQVRTEAADLDNTILKMAAKRGMIAGSLAATGASELFTQDLEDMEAEIAEAVASEEVTEPPLEKAAEKKDEAPTKEAAPEDSKESPKSEVRLISEPQRKRFYAIWKQHGKDEAKVKKWLADNGINDDKSIPLSKYEEACEWAQS